MNKQANTPIPLSPEELSEASNHFGRSLFSAIQLAREQEMQKRLLHDDEGLNSDDTLRIPIPKELMPVQKAAGFDDGAPGVFARAFGGHNKPLRMLVEGQQGFGDARKEYFMSQKKNIQKDLMQAQKEYIDLLSKIKTGSAEETPCVDAFCNGVAHTALFGKQANEQDVDISDGSIKRLLSEVMGVAKKPFQPAIDTAATGLLSTGAGAGYLTYLMRKKMRETPDKYMEDQLPSRVELQPYA